MLAIVTYDGHELARVDRPSEHRAWLSALAGATRESVDRAGRLIVERVYPPGTEITIADAGIRRRLQADGTWADVVEPPAPAPVTLAPELPIDDAWLDAEQT